jgi:hypothetical protein
MSRMKRLLDGLKDYHFECEGGPLENCLEFLELEEIVNILENSSNIDKDLT